MFKTYNVISNANNHVLRNLYVGKIIGERKANNEVVLLVLGAGIEMPEMLAVQDADEPTSDITRIGEHLYACKGVTSIETFLVGAWSFAAGCRAHIVFITPDLFEHEEVVRETSGENFGLPVVIHSDYVRRVMRDTRTHCVTLFVD